MPVSPDRTNRSSYAIIAVLITGFIVSAGVREGIERLSVFLIPACVILLGIMAVYSATLPGFPEAMRYLFTPNFSVLLHADIWLAAFGQALFSLSVGEGILLTYGAYMAQEQDIRKAALIITVADFSVALLAGLVIFPVVFSNGLSPSAGSELAFTTLPVAFSVIPAGRLFSVAFFTVLFFAAITSSVAMLEVCVAAVDEATGWTRKKATVILTALLLPATLLPALELQCPAPLAWRCPAAGRDGRDRGDARPPYRCHPAGGGIHLVPPGGLLPVRAGCTNPPEPVHLHALPVPDTC